MTLKSIAAVAATLLLAAAAPAHAQDTVKIGLIAPMTGPFAPNGKQMQVARKLYMQEHGDTVAGKKIELVVKDDAGVPDNSKRLAQELVVNDGVKFLMGFGLTPIALAVGADRDRGQGARRSSRSPAPRSSPRSRPISCARASRCRSPPSIIADWAAQERHQEGGDAGHRLCARAGRGEGVRRPLQGGRRRDDRVAPRAAAEPGLRAVPAARRRRQARRAVHLRAG